MKTIDNIIKETINSYLKENIESEDWRQLELPFDGNIYKPNYEYFIDYLEKIGEYGKLGKSVSTNHFENINYNNLLVRLMRQNDSSVVYLIIDAACDYIKETYDISLGYNDIDEYGLYDISNTDRAFDKVIEIIQGNYDSEADAEIISSSIINLILDRIKTYIDDELQLVYDNRGLIYVEREIGLSNIMSKPDNFDDSFFVSNMNNDFYKKGVGLCWCYKEGYAESYNGYGDYFITMKGYVDPKDVDWESTIFTNVIFGGDEYEVRMKKNVPIEVDSVIITGRDNQSKNMPLKQPIIVNSGIHA